MKSRMLTALAVLAVLSPLAAGAATGPKVGPKESWTAMQKYEYYIGQLGSALNLCNSFDLANRLQDLAKLTPYGRQGWNSLLAFDDIRGGHCTRYADDASKLLEDREKLWSYLTEKYDCPGGECAPEGGDASATATCRPEVDEHLASLPLASGDVKSVRMLSRFVGATHVGAGKPGHEAWVRLNTCTGWLVIELSNGCYPRRSFTRGECTVDGVSRY